MQITEASIKQLRQQHDTYKTQVAIADAKRREIEAAFQAEFGMDINQAPAYLEKLQAEIATAEVALQAECSTLQQQLTAALTQGLFRLVLKWFGKPDGISLWELWLFPPHKGLEVEVSNVDTLTAISYQWRVHSDHWGHRANVAVAGMELSAQFYDSRHRWRRNSNETLLNAGQHDPQ